MPPAFGVTPAGFVAKTQADVLSSLQSGVLAAFGPAQDLSDSSPDGQVLAIIANAIAQPWEGALAAWNADNRDAAEGTGLDNIGDLTGVPREGQTYTQIYCQLTISAVHAPYASGSLVAYVPGNSGASYSNLNAVQATDISGGSALVLFQATTIGPTATVAPNTLTQIAGAVTGWTAVTNPTGPVQNGQNAELDPDYSARQVEEQPVTGSSSAGAMAAKLIALGAAQVPPVTVTANVLENEGDVPITVNGLTLPPHSMAPVLFDGPTAPLPNGLIAQVVWQNKPAGTTLVGSTAAPYTDPVLGTKTALFSRPTQIPIYVSMTIVLGPGATLAGVTPLIQEALVAAAAAPTPASGIAPIGQLAPGAPVIGAQLLAVVMSVPGVFDVKSITFDVIASPTNTAPIVMSPNQVATILLATAATNVVVSAGTYP